MMLEPSIDVLQDKVSSKYKLVILSSKRARQLSETKDLQVERPQSKKNVGLALEEVAAGKLSVNK